MKQLPQALGYKPGKPSPGFRKVAWEIARDSIVTKALARLLEQVVEEIVEIQVKPLRKDLGLVLSALRYLEDATGEKFDDDGGVIAQIEREHAALDPPRSAKP